MIKTAVENRQNLIVEGCYIPFTWRQDLDERYLPYIRFVCLAFTEQYIRGHFCEIAEHESAIESRIISPDLSAEGLVKDNEYFITGFRQAGEQVVLIGSDFLGTLTELAGGLLPAGK